VPPIVTAVVIAVFGLGVGYLVNRLAGTFPWTGEGGRRTAVRLPFVEVGTALLLGLTAFRFAHADELPAYVVLAAAGVLLVLIDARHKLLPDRVTLPSIGITAFLLALAAWGSGEWTAFGRALLSGLVLFVVFFVLVLISPRSIGMGDAKLAALLGLGLGWLGTGAVLLGIATGFVVQALLAVALLAGRRIGLRGELPFGPSMLLGAALVIGWSDALLR
jgi:leader peptidase (prepilin peptidase)/N-methyltransferase